jgi:uncharacterized protein
VGHQFLEILSTPAVQATRLARAGSDPYEGAAEGPDYNHRLGPAEAAFVAARNGFYLASHSASGWPYIQVRVGPVGFLRVLDDVTLAFADFRGNRQYLTAGNVAEEDRVALFLMDYMRRRRLKLLGRLHFVDDPALMARVVMPGYAAKKEG